LKEELFISDAAWLEGDVLSNEACLRRCSRMTPFIVALVLALPDFSRSVSVELLRGREPRFLDREVCLLICGKVTWGKGLGCARGVWWDKRWSKRRFRRYSRSD
jgi:hypothetical protein